MTIARILLLGILLWLSGMVVSCAGSPPSVPGPDDSTFVPGRTPDTFQIVTYNALHGLATARFGVSPGETPDQNETRFGLVVAQLARERPDVVLLQEVNPLPQRAERYVSALKAHGLEYTEAHQVDACGVRATEEHALFPELNNGLVILAKSELQLQKLTGLKLSGDLGKCQSTSGIQLEELRYGLIAEIRMPGSKAKYLLASTHLHSGFEAGTPFLRTLSDLHREGRFQRYAHFKWDIDQSRLRRIGELNVLTRTLNKLKRDHAYAGIVIGGDLNFEPDFPEYEEVRLLRFSDTSEAALQDRDLFTADPLHNGWIRPAEGATIPQLLQDAIAREDARAQDQIIEAYRAEALRPRKIDYIFVDAFLPGYCLRQILFGLETDDKGLPASDHYGLLNSYSRQMGPCQGNGSK